LILALVQFVAPELSAKLNSTQQFATVLLVSKEMNMLLALKSNAQPMMIVPPMKSATFPKVDREKNVYHSV
jgi:hypothetical protein